MIEFFNVTKKYGSVPALDGVNLKINQNGIICLLGRNGAGKTTLMKLLAGYIPCTDGKISISEKSVSPGKMPDCVSYIESGSLQFNMKVSELLDYAADLQEDFDRDFAKKMTERFELDPAKKFKALSFGMKTMLTTIMMIANNTKIILLDEPTLGFDAILRDQFNTLLMESYSAHPRIIIVSTHLIDEIAKVAERLIIIDRGKILIETGIDNIDENAYTLSGPVKDIEPLLKGLNCIGKMQMGNVMAAHIFDKRISLPENVSDSVSIDRLSLQDFFINIVGGKKNE